MYNKVEQINKVLKKSPSSMTILSKIFIFSLFSYSSLFFVHTTYYNLTWKPNTVSQLEYQLHEEQLLNVFYIHTVPSSL